MKFSASVLGLCIAAGVSFPALAASDATAASTTTQIVDAIFVVDSVDMPNRMLTVKDNRGTIRTLQVPDSLNLPQLKKGDTLRVRYREALAAEIKKPGEGTKGVEQKVTGTPAGTGAYPGHTVQKYTKATINVQAIDTDNNTLTFVGPLGKTRTIAVKDKGMQAYLKKLKPGDHVEVVFREAWAVDVEPAR